MSHQKPPPKITRIRKVIIAVFAVAIIAIIAYGVFYTTDIGAPSEFVEGKHYTIIEGSRPRAGTPVVVREYFSYACIHCKNFDPQVESWREDVDDDVRFERTPVIFSPAWEILARSYYTLASLGALTENHTRLFRAIHENNRQFLSPQTVADFVDGHGVTRDEFLRAYDLPDIRRAVREADELSRISRINGVPSLVVADRYRVNMDEVSRAQAFDVVDFLVAKASEEG